MIKRKPIKKRIVSIDLKPNIPNLILLIKPKHFGFNNETAESNHFQIKNKSKGLTGKVSNEFDAIIAVFKKANISFQIFEDQDTILPDAVFSNNWISNLPSGIVTLYSMQALNRREEIRQDIVDWMMSITDSTQLVDLATQCKEMEFLEGTGSIVFDHFSKIGYACESSRTTISLFEKYCDQIGYRPISFESLDLNEKQIYHTNVMMAIAEKYCLVCLDTIQNELEKQFFKLAIEQSGKIIIAISYPQMNRFLANSFEVLNDKNESCLIMSNTACDSLTNIQKETIEKYSKIIAVNAQTFEQIGGGGIRCMLTGVFV